MRSYSFGDKVVATRNAAGVDYLVTDNQNSVQLSVPAGTSTATVRTHQPYGRPRHTGQHDTDQGWIGQIEDDATGLSYLNARYYDPTIGVFLARDPEYCTLSGDFLPLVLGGWEGRGDYSGAMPVGGWAIPPLRQGAVVLQREYRYRVEELRFLGGYFNDDGNLILQFDCITREYRQEQYAQVGLIGPDETGISGIEPTDNGGLALVWSGSTAPSVVPNSPVTNWTATVEVRQDGTMVEW